MDADRKKRVARATADLLRAVRELNRHKAQAHAEGQRALLADPDPPDFRQAVQAFAEAIAS